MHHYKITVEINGDMAVDHETIVSRIKSFNRHDRFLLFDGGTKDEMRFIMVSETEVLKRAKAKLFSIFESEPKVEKINTESENQKTIKKIQIIKDLMIDEPYNYNKKSKVILTTETCDELLEKADALTCSDDFIPFLANLTDLIGRTASISDKSIYNVVFVKNCDDMNIDPHIELLYKIYASKNLLLEPVMITGGIFDVSLSERETRHVYVIKDEWATKNGDALIGRNAEQRLLTSIFGVDDHSSGASENEQLLSQIKDSGNIYVTSMTQIEFDRLSKLDIFGVAFPNAVVMNELSIRDKIKTVSKIAGEYGFAFLDNGAAENPLIKEASVTEIEIAVRKSIHKKLMDNETDFYITLSDLELKSDTSGKKTPMQELEGLIGLDDVKNTIKEIVALLEKRGRHAVPCLHMSFLGNPGTGKTTVARIIARLFAEVGLIKKDLLIETQRGGLVGKYVGHTAAKTADAVKSALGGVLFIDEAYALIDRNDDCFGKEAISTLVKLMEDRRDDFVCILAGYTDEMDAMLDVNPGLRDRIQFHIDFPDYSLPELIEIFELFCRDNDYKLSETAGAALEAGLSRILNAKSKNFSNGRLVRKLFERTRIKQASRAADNVIIDKDIQDAFLDRDIAKLLGDNHTAIGFQLSA